MTATESKMRAWRWERLKCAIQALAQPAEVQLGLLPDFVPKADELALDFNNFHEACLREMTKLQAEASSAIDNRLSEMGGPNGPWSEDDLAHAPEWTEIRELARKALIAFGWPDEAPPPTDDAFIQ